MTFEEIKAKARKLKIDRMDSLGSRVDDVIDSARVNADDTIYLEKEADPSEWDRIAMDTIVGMLSYSKDKAVIRWFARHGVRA